MKLHSNSAILALANDRRLIQEIVCRFRVYTHSTDTPNPFKALLIGCKEARREFRDSNDTDESDESLHNDTDWEDEDDDEVNRGSTNTRKHNTTRPSTREKSKKGSAHRHAIGTSKVRKHKRSDGHAHTTRHTLSEVNFNPTGHLNDQEHTRLQELLSKLGSPLSNIKNDGIKEVLDLLSKGFLLEGYNR